jgi:hypothetical protein
MSTLPYERGRGIRSALTMHRLQVAVDLGCDIAAATTVPGRVSERTSFAAASNRRSQSTPTT